MTFHDFQNKVVQLFKSEQGGLISQFANVSFSVGEHGNEPNGYLALSALFTDAPLDDPDLLELVISTNTSSPSTKINADVCWGHPSGHVEAEFSHEPGFSQNGVDLTPENLEKIYDDLPRLIAAFKIALQRGKP